jgi:hypothetical protein
MKARWSALVSCALFTVSCTGKDIDIGNGQGSTTATGSGATTVTTTSGEGVTTGSQGSGVTTGSQGSGVTTGSQGSGVTTGTPMTSAVTTGPGTTGSGSTTTGGGPTIPRGTPSALVIRYGDLPDPSIPPTGGSSATTGGGPAIDPNTPFVVIGSNSPTCLNPWGQLVCATWRVMIGIPNDLFKPGVLSLSDTRIMSSASSQGIDRGAGDCSGGGGSYSQGSIEILSVDASTAKVRLSDTFKFDFDADGDYDVAICH